MRRGLVQSHAATITLVQRLLDALVPALLLVSKEPTTPYGVVACVSFLLILLLFKELGLYRSYRGETLLRELSTLLAGWLIVLAALLFGGYLTQTLPLFDSQWIVTWALLAPVALGALHSGVRLLLRALRSRGFNSRRAVIAGAGLVGRRLAWEVQQTPSLGIELVGFLDDQPLADLPAAYLGSLAEAALLVQQQRIDLVYVTLPLRSEQRVRELIDNLRDTTASVYFIPDIFVFNLMQSGIQELNGMPMLAIRESPFYGVQGFIKRLSDVMLAAVIVTLVWPLMLAIAIGVRLSSPGPIIYCQRRYGLNGQEITVYKFRTLYVQDSAFDATAAVAQVKLDDQRVTPLGRWLRRTSLDELPQFINVLQGRMSIVGPRPHAVSHNETYRKLISGYMLRHKVRPGITGLAQVHGLRGETETLAKMERRVRYDLIYLERWSIWLDLYIIGRTVWLLFRDPHAY